MLDLVHLFGRDKNAIRYESGQHIFDRGDDSHDMYVVIEGQVEIVLDEKTVERVGVGGMFGELALIKPNETRSASAIARSDCKLVVVDRKRFVFLIQQTPYFALHVMQVLTERLRRETF